jgi:hypothetical protein
MKNKLIVFIAALSLLMFNYSCDDKLDIPPLNILTSDQVFQSQSGIIAYLVSLYDVLPTDDHRFTGADAQIMNSSDEAIGLAWRNITGIPDGTWTYLNWWGYSYVRNVNDFIAKLPEANLSEGDKNTIMGEAKFIRAFYYFGMVKRYGGVPIIKEVQNFTGDNFEELQVPRNTEKEVWDFIATDLDEAAALLPEISVSGRANKYTALALKSRAMLYAASIAKYGSVMLDGVLGIPSSDANSYWQKSYDAAQLVINSGKYSLYDKNPNKETNFSELFLATSNPEAVFTVSYLYPTKTHGYDCWFLPFGYRSPNGYSSQMAPSLELVEQYEYVDGTPGTLKLKNPDDSPIYYPDATDLFVNKDPRCMATVIVPFANWRGNVIDVQAGIYDQGVKWEASEFTALYNPITHQPDNINGTLHIVGNNGFGAGATEKSFTGFYLRKYLNSNLDQSRATTTGSDQQFIAIRYAETLLNYAEAAVELNKIPDAKLAVNLVRARAGIRLLDDIEVTLDRIKHERLVELAFENHRWWDYGRWRISDDILTNFWNKALLPYWDIQANAYRFETRTASNFPKTFVIRAYYQRIDPNEIVKNPNLVQNPGY